MDASILHRLLSIDEAFFSAISTRDGLQTFHKTWSKLTRDIGEAVGTQALSANTMNVAHSIAERIAIVADSFLDFTQECEGINSRLEQDLGEIFSKISFGEAPTSPPAPQQAVALPSSSLPPYIQPAYAWLLSNLHNPYPSKKVRNDIALQTGNSYHSIDSWFIDTRRKIGWSKLRKTRFSNKRVDAVDAATRFFLECDPKRPLDPNLELEFAGIESSTKDLYSDKLLESVLVTKLDVAVRDMTPKMAAQVKAEAKKQKVLRRRRNDKVTRDALSYPSPEQSPEPSIQPIQELERRIVSTSGKRRSPPYESSSSGDEAQRSVEGPNKRSRYVGPAGCRSLTQGFSGLNHPHSALVQNLLASHLLRLRYMKWPTVALTYLLMPQYYQAYLLQLCLWLQSENGGYLMQMASISSNVHVACISPLGPKRPQIRF